MTHSKAGIAAVVAGGLLAGLVAPPAGASERLSSFGRSQQIVIRVDKSDQEMTVYQGARRLYSWPVSTGMAGYDTPVGTYQPQWFSPNHRSSQYGGAPMPWAVFFFEGYAIHATDAVGMLGRPASHGCVRLDMQNAAEIYALLDRVGKDNAYIVVQD
ncbi:MAG: L,D-transpeptidase [Alphaproteobacteria bacterium]|nr:MAG: L,D-transpeptidase [Alphaproteobacteria bacterium]